MRTRAAAWEGRTPAHAKGDRPPRRWKKTTRFRSSSLALVVLLALPACAQEITLLDSDNFARGLHAPSFEQAVSWTDAFYDRSHRAIQLGWGSNERYGKLSVILFDFVSAALLPAPLGDTWVHEEAHRAVLANRGVASFDDVYRFRWNPGAISVSHVRDDALVRLKSEHPNDLIRAHEAGVEGEHALILRMEKEHFFDGATSWNLPLYWMIKANSVAYIASGSTDEANKDTDAFEREEGTHVSRRDFTGHDFTAWVYDLFRPDEPYQARGIHPSGVGIRRYIRESDLTDSERSYLHRQGRLALINFLDPNLIGLYGDRFNVSAAHVLTSFGYAVDVHALLHARRDFAVTLHRYANGARSFPGLEIETPHRLRIALWQQPQRFRDRGGKLGGLARGQWQRGRYFGALEVKSAGWVEGNVHLDRSVEAWVGLVYPMR